jgi:hypothetical protein
MQSRREFGKLALTGLSLSMIPTCTLADPKSDATVRGVKLGGITGAYGPFNAGPGEDVIDVVIRQSIATGAGHVELVNSVIEPPMGGRADAGAAADVAELQVPGLLLGRPVPLRQAPVPVEAVKGEAAVAAASMEGRAASGARSPLPSRPNTLLSGTNFANGASAPRSIASARFARNSTPPA